MKATIVFALIALVALSEARVSLLPKQKSNINDENALPKDVNFGAAFRNFTLAIKNMMPCGFKPWNLPPLAPFTMANWTFDFHNAFYSVAGDLSNIVVTGVNDFRILDLTYDPKSGKIVYDVIYYDIKVLAQYNVSSWAMVAGYNSTMEGNGPFNVELKDMRSIVEFTMGSNNNGGSRISDFKMSFFVGDVITGSWNYKWDIAFNNFVNKWFREFILMGSQQIQGEVRSYYDKHVLPMVNDSLEYISMDQIISFLVEQTKLINASHCGAQKSS